MTQTSSRPLSANVPEEVIQQATTYQLGDFSGSFKPTFSNPFALIGLVIGSIILDIIVLVTIAYFVGLIFYYLVLFPIFVIIFAIGALPKHNLRIYLFAQGFVSVHGKLIETVRWEQIESIWQKEGKSSYTTSAYTCTLRLKDGKTMKLENSIKFIRQLTSIIQQEVTKLRFPQLIAAYNNGETVSFGKIKVNTQGINNGKELIPWDQADTIVTKEGLVLVQKYGRTLKWSSVKEQETPNLVMLTSLVHYAVGAQK